MGGTFHPRASIADIRAKESSWLQNTSRPLVGAVGQCVGGEFQGGNNRHIAKGQAERKPQTSEK